MNMIFAYLCQLFVAIIAVQNDDLLLNGLEFPSSIYIPFDKSYLLECNSKNIVYWKLYLNNGKIEIINDKLIRLNEFDKNRDGFYQCHTNYEPLYSRSVFIFSNGAHSIDRNWTKLTEFHENLVTICRPMYFNYGFNEQFIELIDSKQTIRYNRTGLVVKHIRSTTHLFCKLHMDTTCVGIRVQTLIKKDTPFLSDEYLKTNDFLEMNTNERDIYRIAFEGDSVYFHCPSNMTLSIQWNFLSFNYYLMTTLPTLYDEDTKINSVTIADAGIYICRTETIIYQRIILTIIHPPKSPDNIYERTLNVNLYSKYLMCCNLDAVPYPTYSWSMITEFQNTSFVWCSKRCCWLHIIYRIYQNIICTSTNQIGMAKYNIHLNVQDMDSKDTIVYDEPKLYNYNHTDNVNFIRETIDNSSINPTVMTTDVKTHTSEEKTSITHNNNNESEKIFLPLLSSSSNDSNINSYEKLDEMIP
ncbi:unnamed protein product [Rotaria sordida]|uniref:Ig-like domain-containing protein n=1 Tax=Rotaria sordida TaxID=392033 RepID=A0A819BVG6_9BILA|nr:unnamed protein product [Rotaria sordida]CAF3797903.1 unnamed protein product [Rotaria sordida]